MSNTLFYGDNITRIGYSIIDNVKIVQYECNIPLNNPKNIRIVITKLNEELYKANRDVCRNDLAEFEDMAYRLQDDYLAKMSE